MTGERVYVVPRRAVLDDAGWHGIRTHGLEAFIAALERDGRYEPRSEMERDPSFKQVIPYLVLRDGPRWFLMRRTDAGGDPRLHGRYSIGVGGHLNPGDGGLLGGLHREWAEEVVADFVPEFRLVALLNDDTTEVGAVHLGAVYVADAAGRPVTIRETDKLTGAFVETAEVAAVAEGLETWSRLAFEFLVGRDAAEGAEGLRAAGTASAPGTSHADATTLARATSSAPLTSQADGPSPARASGPSAAPGTSPASGVGR